jgi:stage II sporulation protein D
MSQRALTLLTLISLLLCFSCGRPPRRVAEPTLGAGPNVRLKLGSFQEAKISSGGGALIECWRGGEIKGRFYGSFELMVSISGGRISLEDQNLGGLAGDLTKIVVSPGSNSPRFRFQERTYRGNLELFSGPEDRGFIAVNELDMESYLKGVLPAEMGQRAPEEYEALKAQAVAARTYALYKLSNQKGAEDYLHATVLDQVYRGYDSELPLSNRAVDETRGQVLLHRGQLISAHYHAICGGFTEDVSNVWGGEQKRYLSSVEDDDFCSWPASYLWEESFTPQELLEKVTSYTKEKNLDPEVANDTLRSVRVLLRMKSGRVRELLVETTNKRYVLRSDSIRWALSRTDVEIKILPSTMFGVALRQDSTGKIISIDFFGRGKGHGVGMCQCGAIGRARKGHRYDQILEHYYTGTHLSNAY